VTKKKITLKDKYDMACTMIAYFESQVKGHNNVSTRIIDKRITGLLQNYKITDEGKT
jgi:hypothetical protein